MPLFFSVTVKTPGRGSPWAQLLLFPYKAHMQFFPPVTQHSDKSRQYSAPGGQKLVSKMQQDCPCCRWVLYFHTWGLLSMWVSESASILLRTDCSNQAHRRKHREMLAITANIQIASKSYVLQSKTTETLLLCRHHLQEGEGAESTASRCLTQTAHDNSCDRKWVVSGKTHRWPHIGQLTEQNTRIASWLSTCQCCNARHQPQFLFFPYEHSLVLPQQLSSTLSHYMEPLRAALKRQHQLQSLCASDGAFNGLPRASEQSWWVLQTSDPPHSI